MRHRLAVILPIYVALFAISLTSSYLLRFEFSMTSSLWSNVLAALPLFIAAKLFAFSTLREWDRTFRYATINDAFVTAICCTIGATGMLALRTITPESTPPIPRSIILLDGLLTTLLVSGLRIGCRLLWNSRLQSQKPEHEPALIYGNDLTAIGIWKMLTASNGHLGRYRVVGFIDPGPECQRSLIGGLPVYSLEESLERASSHDVQHILVPTTVPGRVVRDLLHETRHAGISVHKIPTVEEIVEGRFRLAVRELDIDDLLRRPATQLDLKEIRELISDKTVLVTGGAGSIGSELCRQIVGFKPNRLVVYDHSEFGVFEIEREFARQNLGDIEINYVTASVLDADALEQVFAEFQPELVFHAAAYKHVPLMQDNPYAAVRNNIQGTKAVVDAAHRHGSERFVLISTDKAVRPTSVMGATKLMAEKYLQAMSQQSQTEFITVRFGNVLNSVGSVVPTFRKQIEEGGPVTVTHRDMVRYFMTIPEAVQLVLQAGASGQSGHVLILDMGDPVKIVDLAKDMITLSGLSYPDDIDIKFTGLRPGEKMYEELFYQHEKGAVKVHEKIFLGSGYAPSIQEINTDLARLNASLTGTRGNASSTLWNVVDRYVSIDDQSNQQTTLPRAA
ncbi:MAG: polysaccharide biosynthesis protein [Rubinisphaera brasiliensis]|uniref:polysaccharide biosynthesis protein n=1 Tax=Rubinisphaera brasiliensis TaxID=119 RepID=UPI00391D1E41